MSLPQNSGPLEWAFEMFQIRAEAAYLYDAVHLYAKALVKLLVEGKEPRNGTAVIECIKRTHYKSAMG